MVNKVTIRKAVSDDLDAIGGLWQELMDFHKELDPHFTRSTDGHVQFQEFISNHIKSYASCVLVAEDDSKAVVGYCLATLAKHPPIFDARDYGIVFDLAVTQRCRRLGIGERLYRETESWFADQGIHRIEVRVSTLNEASAAFWWKMDFNPYITTEFKNLDTTVIKG
jgi:ribosomal protein S18 acetylase RimI-like enzyme